MTTRTTLSDNRPPVKPNGKLPDTGANKFKVWTLGELAEEQGDDDDPDFSPNPLIYDPDVLCKMIFGTALPIKKIRVNMDVAGDPENTAEILEFIKSDTAEIIQFVKPNTAEILKEFRTPGDTAEILDFIKPTKPKAKFAIVWPDQFESMTPPQFWDPETKLIPRDDTEGSTALIYGQPGSHKTNLVLTLIFDMVERGAKVVYAAGEGSLGVGKNRIPAHAAARGIAVKDLRGKLAVIRAVPLLQQSGEVEELIETCRQVEPNVVVIDTLATATAGLDENNSMFSTLLTDNGAVGKIKRAFKATVIVIAHEGKTNGKGARGHSGLHGNVDAAIQVIGEKSDPRVLAQVTKMRDGADDFSVHYLIKLGEVPVPRRVTEAEFNAAAPGAEQARVKEDADLAELLMVLQLEGACPGGSHEWKPLGIELGEGGLTAGDLADAFLKTRGSAITGDVKKAKDAILDDLRWRVEKKGSRFAAYRVGKCGRNWRWAIPIVDPVLI